MYVCVCHGVTDRNIKEAVGCGACRMRDLKQKLGVSSQCGKCACHAKEVLDAALSESRSQLIDGRSAT
ncbi:MAG: bacterioferritin-associated ferredoxin [Thiobacillaceae bacterium]